MMGQLLALAAWSLVGIACLAIAAPVVWVVLAYGPVAVSGVVSS